jgi:hypothetical protein
MTVHAYQLAASPSKLHVPLSPGVATARVCATTVLLGEGLCVECALESEATGAPLSRGIARVRFPDEARALLLAISWGTGYRIVDTLSEIATDYVERNLTTHTPASRHPASAARIAEPAFSFDMPLCDFRAGLEAVSPAGPEARRGR